MNKNPLWGMSLQYDWQKCRDWVESMDVQDVNIIDFYCGKARAKDRAKLTDEKREFIFRELFLDALSIEALSFSKKVNPKDFSFKLRREGQHHIRLIIEYAPSGAQKVKGDVKLHDFYLKRNCKIGEMDMVNSLFWSFSVLIMEVTNSP